MLKKQTRNWGFQPPKLFNLFIPLQRQQTEAWSTDINNIQRGVDWQMKVDDARCKLTSIYPKIKL
jgi:hypothetical protein